MRLEVKSVNFDFNSSSTLCLYIVCLLCTVRLLRVVSLIFYRVMVFIVPLRISCFACSLCIAFILIWQFNWYLSRGVKSGCGFLVMHFIVCVFVWVSGCVNMHICVNGRKLTHTVLFLNEIEREVIIEFSYLIITCFFSFGGKELTKTATKNNKTKNFACTKVIISFKGSFLIT